MARERRGRGRASARETLAERVGGGLAELVPDRDRAHGWTLLLDGAPQSYVDLADPGHLGFAYQRRLGHVADLSAPSGQPLRVAHLGGGALTLARYIAASRPRSTQRVLELDTALSQLVRRELPLDGNWRIKVRGVDARAGLAGLSDHWADLVISDVFRAARTPAHLVSTEFVGELRRTLRPGGWYAANITDGPCGATGSRLGHLRSHVATCRALFADCAVLAEPAVLRGRRFGNAVLIAADQPLPVTELGRRAAVDPQPARIVHGGALTDFTAGAAAVTDATATPSPAPPPGTFT